VASGGEAVQGLAVAEEYGLLALADDDLGAVGDVAGAVGRDALDEDVARVVEGLQDFDGQGQAWKGGGDFADLGRSRRGGV